MYQDVNQSLDQAHSWRWWHEGVNVFTDVDEVNTVSQQADYYRAIDNSGRRPLSTGIFVPEQCSQFEKRLQTEGSRNIDKH